jgi:anti-sigma B factor antagonist
VEGAERFVSERREVDDVVVVALSGELDLSTAPALRERLLAICDSGKSIVLDFRNVTFADSTTLGVLVATHKRLRDQHGRLTIANVDPSVRQVFAITSLDSFIPICDSREGAITEAARAGHDESRDDPATPA